jgi:phosphatidylinositol kinase/protein kinase (PI-3  family)
VLESLKQEVAAMNNDTVQTMLNNIWDERIDARIKAAKREFNKARVRQLEVICFLLSLFLECCYPYFLPC